MNVHASILQKYLKSAQTRNLNSSYCSRFVAFTANVQEGMGVRVEKRAEKYLGVRYLLAVSNKINGEKLNQQT